MLGNCQYSWSMNVKASTRLTSFGLLSILTRKKTVEKKLMS